MACLHKFHHHLDLQKIDFVPVTLIVGTFNPSWPDNNTAEWFYGRTEGIYLWDVLPRIYGEDTMINANAAEWKRFCRDKQVAFTDLISSIDDAMPGDARHQKILGGFSDDAIQHNFDDLVFVNIVQLLRLHPSIKQVYLTRGLSDAFWRHLWNPVAHYCNHNKIRERKLLTPSDDALYQFEAYKSQNPQVRMSTLSDYILMRWQEELQLAGN